MLRLVKKGTSIDIWRPLPIMFKSNIVKTVSPRRCRKSPQKNPEKQREDVQIPAWTVVDDESWLDENYPEGYQRPPQLIRSLDSDLSPKLPDYDADEEDDDWLSSRFWTLDVLDFERVMELLERHSSPVILTLDEVIEIFSSLESYIVMDIYDFWLDKRLKEGKALMPEVRKSKSSLSMDEDSSFVAFRPLSGKVVTRDQQRKYEESYREMLQLRDNLKRALHLLKLVQEREALKRTTIEVEKDIFEKRFLTKDFEEFHCFVKIPLLRLISLPEGASESSGKENRFVEPQKQKDDETFEFRPREGCNYLKPSKTFRTTPKAAGCRGRRGRGRGGRLLAL